MTAMNPRGLVKSIHREEGPVWPLLHWREEFFRFMTRPITRIGFLMILTAMVALPMPVSAQMHGIGIGVEVGEPTGISGKIWVSPVSAFDWGAAWTMSTPSSTHFHADYITHAPAFFPYPTPAGGVSLTAGMGVRAVTEPGQTRIGIRLPLGLVIAMGLPVDWFIHIVPTLDVSPTSQVVFNGGTGVRYFF